MILWDNENKIMLHRGKDQTAKETGGKMERH